MAKKIPRKKCMPSPNIPDEAEKVRELIALVPKGVDRKFTTLARAVDDLRRQNTNERFVIFTQYLETLAFLRDEIGKAYGMEQIAIIRGGPLDEKNRGRRNVLEGGWREVFDLHFGWRRRNQPSSRADSF
jgi:ERCC4-related helicase